MRRLALFALLSMGVVACRAEKTSTPDDATAERATDERAEGPRIAHIGVPHGASIERMVIAPGADGVLSADKAGSVRLWPALDGSHEPLPIPVRGPRAMSLAAQGEDWIVAVVDSAGGTHIMRVDPRGKVENLADITPFQPVRAVTVLPGGKRVLVLGEDHRIRMFSSAGNELGTLEERDFRPAHMFINASGDLMTVAVKDRLGGKIKAEAQRIEVGPAKLALSGAPTAFRTTVEPGPESFCVSPDGKRFAYLERENNKWHAISVDLDSGRSTDIDLEMQDNQTPTLGFVANDRLFVTSRDRGMAWLVDVENKTRWPRVTAHQPSQPMPVVHGPGLQVVGYGMWLAVQKLDDNEIDYLGYRSFVAQSGAMSPSGKHIAWSLGGELLIESADGSGPTHRVRPNTPFASQFVSFVDDDHLVVAGTDGALRIYRWQDDELVDEMSLGTGLQAAHFDLANGLILAHRMFGDAAIVEVTADLKLEGPYLVSDGAFLMGVASTGATEPAIWTLDGTQKLRKYTLAELRGDLSQQQASERGDTLAIPGGGRVVAVDGRGNYYLIVTDGLQTRLERRHGEDAPVKVSLGAHRVNQLVMSPDGKHVVAVADTGTLLGFDAQTLESKWSFANTQMQGNPSFSPDGKHLLVMSSTGAALIDASTGKVLSRRCGIEFGRRGAPPFDAFSFMETASFCEQ